MQPILTLKPGRERAVINRHPWIYSGAIKNTSPGVEDGDLVQVTDSQGRLLAYGHFTTQGSISCRIFYFCDAPVAIDDAFWLNKFEQAFEYRQSIGVLNAERGSAFRLFFSEGDELPGLICDVFSDVAVLQMRTTAMLALAPLISQFLQDKLSIKHVFSRGEKRHENKWLLGNKPEVIFYEGGVQLIVDIEHGQKTGFFLDQRDNRLMLQALAEQKSVLNAFSYSGGFSAHALKGGASKVVSVDISQEAIELCDRTIALNSDQLSRHQGVAADCFDYLRDMPNGEFDLIVLDPPAFAKNAASVNKATRGYKDINLSALRKIRSGGFLFTFSCSHHISRDLFRKFIFGACADAKRPVRIMHELSQPADHPVSIYHPEGEYLKGLVLQII